MKPFRNILILVLSLLMFPVNGQILFVADVYSGCDSLQVTFKPWIPSTSRDTISTIRWEFGDGKILVKNNFDPVIAHYQSPGQYRPRMVINNDTTITANFIINVDRSPDAFFYYSDTAEIGTFTIVFTSTGQIDGTLSYTYQWFLSKINGMEYLNDTTPTNARFLIHPFDSADIYFARLIVQSSSSARCSATQTRVIEVRDTLDIPNVFSPNEDNINDHWVVRSNGKTVYSVKIFARTGTLVYQAESPIITWDGRNQSGQEMAADTYFYLIEPVKFKTRFKKTGFVQLYR